MSGAGITGLVKVKLCTVNELRQRLNVFPDDAYVAVGCVEPDALAILDPNKNILENVLGHIMLSEPADQSD